MNEILLFVICFSDPPSIGKDGILYAFPYID